MTTMVTTTLTEARLVSLFGTQGETFNQALFIYLFIYMDSSLHERALTCICGLPDPTITDKLRLCRNIYIYVHIQSHTYKDTYIKNIAMHSKGYV